MCAVGARKDIVVEGWRVFRRCYRRIDKIGDAVCRVVGSERKREG